MWLKKTDTFKTFRVISRGCLFYSRWYEQLWCFLTDILHRKYQFDTIPGHIMPTMNQSVFGLHMYTLYMSSISHAIYMYMDVHLSFPIPFKTFEVSWVGFRSPNTNKSLNGWLARCRYLNVTRVGCDISVRHHYKSVGDSPACTKTAPVLGWFLSIAEPWCS